ncbi:MAG: hypothetical protein AAB429_01605 [Patescibacteria group bacterium]
MDKNSLFILLIIASGVGAALLFQRGGDVEPAAVAVSAVENSTQDAKPSQSKDGIEIIIADIEQLEATTVLTVVLDNHSVDLGKEAIYQGATLNGKPPRSYTFIANASGGHHVEVEMTFDKTTSGSFDIAPAEATEFTFDDLWQK